MPIPKKPRHSAEAAPEVAPRLTASGHDISRKARPGDSRAMSDHHDASAAAGAAFFVASLKFAGSYSKLTGPTIEAAALAAAALETASRAFGNVTRANLYAVAPNDAHGNQGAETLVAPAEWRPLADAAIRRASPTGETKIAPEAAAVAGRAILARYQAACAPAPTQAE